MSSTRTGTPLPDLRWSLRARMAWRRAARALRQTCPGEPEPDPRPVQASGAARTGLVAVTVAYVGYVSYLTLRIHWGFGTAGFDIGIFDQGVWLLSRFQDPFVTVRGLHLFGEHTSFLLLGLVPAYWVAASPSVLLVAQSLALGAGAMPVFLLAREKLRSEPYALGCAVAYLAHPAIAWTNFENFHPDAFEVPLVLLAFYLVLEARWRWFLVCVAALLLVKEDVALLTLALGLYVAFVHRRDVGLVTAGVSVLWMLAAFFLVLPAFNEAGTLYTGRVTGQFGGAGGLLETAVTRPWEILAVAFGAERRWYLWQLIAPFGLLSLAAPLVLLVATGPLLVNLLSTFGYQHQIEYHYSTLIIPVLAVAAVYGIARFRSMRSRGVLVLGMALAAVAAGLLWGPLGPGGRAVPDPDSPHARAAREAIAMIPDDAAVSASFAYVPHLTHRDQIYEFPTPWQAANWGDWSREGQRLPAADEVDYLLVSSSLLDDPEYRRIVERLRRDDFQRMFASEGVLLLARNDRAETSG